MVPLAFEKAREGLRAIGDPLAELSARGIERLQQLGEAGPSPESVEQCCGSSRPARSGTCAPTSPGASIRAHAPMVI